MSESKYPDFTIVGLCDPNYKVQNIPILKNASSFITNTLTQLNWQVKPIPINKKIARFVVLRDPYERWLTAFTEDIKVFINSRTPDEIVYLNNLFQNNDISWFIDFLLDRDILYFDTHAQLQIKQLDWIIECIGKDNLTWVKMTDKLGHILNHWLHGEGCKNNFNNAKIHATDKINDDIYRRIEAYFFDAKNFKYKAKVLEYLAPDYELYNSVNFINPN
jgi:hypothetical protein